jgi:hypothetical protein
LPVCRANAAAAKARVQKGRPSPTPVCSIGTKLSARRPKKTRIGCDGAVKQQQGLCIRSFSQFNERCNGSHIEIARGEIGGCFGLCSPDFRISHLGLNRSCDVGSDLVLKIKDFLKLAVISFGPDVAAGVCVDQLSSNAQAAPGKLAMSRFFPLCP